MNAFQNEAKEKKKVEQAINSIFPAQKFNKEKDINLKQTITKTYLQ